MKAILMDIAPPFLNPIFLAIGAVVIAVALVVVAVVLIVRAKKKNNK